DKVLHEPPLSPRKMDGHIPRDLETIVLKCLAKEPGERYASAEALAEDLQRFLADRPIKARRASLAEQTWRWARRNPAGATLFTAVLLLVLLVAVVTRGAAVWLSAALRDSENAKANANDKLWGSYLAQARASRMTRQPGQHFDSLRAIREAMKLP